MNLRKTITTIALITGGIGLASSAHAAPFSYLHSDFEQELIVTGAGTGQGMAGVTLGLDGKIYTNDPGGNVVQKWDPNSRVSMHGSSVATRVGGVVNSAYNGWGITTDSSGGIYALSAGGLQKVDTTTLTPTYVGSTLGGVYGLAYEAGRDTFLSSNGNSIIRTTKAGVSSVIANSPVGFIDQVAIDPTGQFIAGAALGGQQVVLWNASTGAVVQIAGVGHAPDGIAFDADGNIYTNNTDGTITRIDFASGYAAGATGTELIASGGCYGDLAGVGADGSFYVSQYCTHFDDGTVTSDHSIVRISRKGGGGFVDGGAGGGGTVAVAEPNTLALLALALTGIGFSQRKQRRKL